MGKTFVRCLLAATLLATTSGCYPLGLNAQSYTKPVSMSGSLGRPARVVRHFRYELVTWYLAGIWPIATLPGADNPWMPADKLVMALIHKEIVLDGDGVVNLRVSQSITPTSLGLQLVPAGALALVPGSSIWVGGAFAAAFQPIAVTVEGDVVKYGRGAALPGPVIKAAGEGLELDGLNLPRMLQSAMQGPAPGP